MKYESQPVTYTDRDAAILKACNIPTNPDELSDKVSKFKHALLYFAENWKIGKAAREKTERGFSFYISYFLFKVYITELLATDLNHPFMGMFKEDGQWRNADQFALTQNGWLPGMNPYAEKTNMLEDIKKHIQLESVNVPGQLNGKCPFCLGQDCVIQINTQTQTYRTTVCHTMTGWDKDENRIRVPDPQSRSLSELSERLNDPIAYVMRNL